MRADLAAALLHNPKVLYLDEPTIGLDIVVKDKILQAIREINKKYSTTVILTTHDINDIEKYIQSEIYLIFNTNENKIETSENYLKVYLNQHFKDIKCFIVKDSIYSYREISINGVFKNVFFYNTHNEEIYNKVFLCDFYTCPCLFM